MTPRPPESPATAFAVALLEEFHRLGVRDIVLGPGSRSQALALAAAEFERLGMIRLRVRLAERVGGFLALGIAVLQEIMKPDRDWSIIATTLAGIVIGIGGGAYGRVKAEGPITSVLPK